MNFSDPSARAAIETIRGEHCADVLLAQIERGAADADALLDEVKLLAPEPPALRGFLRRLQKLLQHRVPR